MIRRKFSGRDLVGTLTLCKLLVILLRRKKWFHTFYFEIQLDRIAKLISQSCKGNRNFLFCIQRRSDGCKKMGIVRNNGVLLLQLQCTDKGSLQFRQKMKRTA